ncbi:MAG: nucleotidyltransferase domain-containing protein [Gemmatimonadetes bacterium]|nr:nucleotidyltransferase domain-containing protein [Gemmatimonadota bacterium]
MRDDLIAAAKAVHSERYADAEVVFLAGSLVRGEGTSTSDLDLVVVFRTLPQAYRESYRFGGWPVEAFVHDPQTLAYFFHKVDRPSGIPSLPAMVSEGIEIPRSSALSRALKAAATALIAEGPPAWTRADIDSSRYAITGLVDDLREPRSRAEQVATAAALHAALSNHFLRRRGAWSAKGKTIPRQLRKIDAVFSETFSASFNALLERGEPAQVITLAEYVLAEDGGWLMEGYRLPAPPEWRLPTDSAG